MSKRLEIIRSCVMSTRLATAPVLDLHQALLNEPPMLPMWRSAKYMGISRTKAYELHREGQFPIEVLEIGSRLRCRRIELLAYLGLTASGVA
jgi:predicted DNA-binding transcriptional regulator AlpA